jgi:hypothetical protein
MRQSDCGGIRIELRYFQTRTLTPFAVYCLAFGALSVIRSPHGPVREWARASGAPRIRADLRRSGRRHSGMRVARLMRRGVRHRFPGG